MRAGEEDVVCIWDDARKTDAVRKGGESGSGWGLEGCPGFGREVEVGVGLGGVEECVLGGGRTSVGWRRVLRRSERPLTLPATSAAPFDDDEQKRSRAAEQLARFCTPKRGNISLC